MATINGKYTDLKIICGDRDWKVHKTQILSCSPVLEAKYEKMVTAHLSDEDPSVVDEVLHFCYDHTLLRAGLDDESFARRLVATYRFASKYEMDALKLHAKDIFELVATDDWSAAYFPELTKDIFSAERGDNMGIAQVLEEIFKSHRDSIVPAGIDSNALWEAICTIPLLAAAIARVGMPSTEEGMFLQ